MASSKCGLPGLFQSEKRDWLYRTVRVRGLIELRGNFDGFIKVLTHWAFPIGEKRLVVPNSESSRAHRTARKKRLPVTRRAIVVQVSVNVQQRLKPSHTYSDVILLFLVEDEELGTKTNSSRRGVPALLSLPGVGISLHSQELEGDLCEWTSRVAFSR